MRKIRNKYDESLKERMENFPVYNRNNYEFSFWKETFLKEALVNNHDLFKNQNEKFNYLGNRVAGSLHGYRFNSRHDFEDHSRLGMALKAAYELGKADANKPIDDLLIDNEIW